MIENAIETGTGNEIGRANPLEIITLNQPATHPLGATRMLEMLRRRPSDDGPTG